MKRFNGSWLILDYVSSSLRKTEGGDWSGMRERAKEDREEERRRSIEDESESSSCTSAAIDATFRRALARIRDQESSAQSLSDGSTKEPRADQPLDSAPHLGAERCAPASKRRRVNSCAKNRKVTTRKAARYDTQDIAVTQGTDAQYTSAALAFELHTQPYCQVPSGSLHILPAGRSNLGTFTQQEDGQDQERACLVAEIDALQTALQFARRREESSLTMLREMQSELHKVNQLLASHGCRTTQSTLGSIELQQAPMPIDCHDSSRRRVPLPNDVCVSPSVHTSWGYFHYPQTSSTCAAEHEYAGN